MIELNNQVFALETEQLGYYITQRGELAETLHFGRKLHPSRAAMTERMACTYGSDVVYQQSAGCDSLYHLCLELSPAGKGDFRQTALELRLADGAQVIEFRLAGHTIHDGAVAPDGMPGAYGAEQTLELVFDSPQGVTVRQFYGVYPDSNVITWRLEVENHSGAAIRLERCMSYQLDLPEVNWTLTTFTGAWARERHETVVQTETGIHRFGSRTGVSSHYCNPFFMVCEAHATEHHGRVYGFNLIYSGSHQGQVEVTPFSKTRIQAGIQADGFGWTLEDGDAFQTPEAVLSFSDQGKNGLSRNMHHFVQNHISRGKWAKAPRPVLLNNWEATYFDFRESSLLALAKKAVRLGMELFVLDDGWFGKRDQDNCSLGDYSLNSPKLPQGLDGLAKKINALGLDFGLWFEPEMVNPDSDLYRAHPDWAVQTPGSDPCLSRNQLALDLCRVEVQDYIIENVNRILKSAPIRYVKWDMNRPLTDCWSPALCEQSRFHHAWCLGLYRVMGAIVSANPEILFEGCASGGNRFDLGILSYMSQIWTSDDTDCYERMKIQTGTSYGYPQSVMGCHVSACPNHQTTRSSPIEARFDVAAFGMLGYELDLGVLSSAEEKAVAKQVAFYKEHRKLLQYGTFYRLRSPFREEFCSWIVVSADRKEAMVLDAIGRMMPNSEATPIRLKGLDPDMCYEVTVRPESMDLREFGSLINHVVPFKVNSQGLLMHVVADHYMLPTEEEHYSAWGDCLMEAGLRRKQSFTGTGYNQDIRMMPDYSARLYYLKAVE